MGRYGSRREVGRECVTCVMGRKGKRKRERNREINGGKTVKEGKEDGGGMAAEGE